MLQSEADQETLTKLRNAMGWLDREHGLWVENKPSKYDYDQFFRILDNSVVMEEVLRMSGYKGCILGADRTCSATVVMSCDYCVGR